MPLASFRISFSLPLFFDLHNKLSVTFDWLIDMRIEEIQAMRNLFEVRILFNKFLLHIFTFTISSPLTQCNRTFFQANDYLSIIIAFHEVQGSVYEWLKIGFISSKKRSRVKTSSNLNSLLSMRRKMIGDCKNIKWNENETLVSRSQFC